MRPDSDIWAIVAIGLGWKAGAKGTAGESLLEAAARCERRCIHRGRRDDSQAVAAQVILRLTADPAERTAMKAWGAVWRAAKILADSPLGLDLYWPEYAKHTESGKLGPPPGTPTIRVVYLLRRKQAIAEIIRKRREARSLILAMGSDVPS